MLGSKGDIYSAGYTTSRHEKWEEMANQGMSFIDILSQTYSGAIPIDCVIINDNKENIITDGTEIPQNLPPLTADQAQWAQMIIEKAMEIYEKYNGDFSYMSPSEAAAVGKKRNAGGRKWWTRISLMSRRRMQKRQPNVWKSMRICLLTIHR